MNIQSKHWAVPECVRKHLSKGGISREVQNVSGLFATSHHNSIEQEREFQGRMQKSLESEGQDPNSEKRRLLNVYFSVFVINLL